MFIIGSSWFRILELAFAFDEEYFLHFDSQKFPVNRCKMQHGGEDVSEFWKRERLRRRGLIEQAPGRYVQIILSPRA